MPKTKQHKPAIAFGQRLVTLLERAGHKRRGAGRYLAEKYGVSAVTANAWLNGQHMCETETAQRIARDHGSTFEALYFGTGDSRPGMSPKEHAASISELLPAATPRTEARLTIYRQKLERGDALTATERRDLASIIKRLEALNAAIT